MTDGELDAYFRRIAYAGGGAPTLETLRDLHRRHAELIPFENLNPLLGRPVRLDFTSLLEKLVREGRGGYCYEQNLLFQHVLKSLGYRVTGLSAGVVWNRPPEEITPRTHVLLRVDLEDGAWLADVGFGGQTLTGPVRMEADGEQGTPHEPYRLVRCDESGGGEFELQAEIRGEWRPLYRFDLRPQRLVDYEVGNWYVSTHPGSAFVNGLMASRAPAGGRYTLFNNSLAVHRLGGESERRMLATAAELREALTDILGITLPNGPGMNPLLERIAASDPPPR